MYMSCITTFTGLEFDPVRPEADRIEIRDIAHALSMICRGNGHVRSFWSVGQHCIACAKEAEARGLGRRMVLACLLHDAGECYLSDVPRPFKQEMPRYRELEGELMRLIYVKFLGSDLTEQERRQVKEIDDALLWYDLKYLLGQEPGGEAPEVHIDVDFSVRAFADVEREYLEMFGRCND